MNRKRLLKSFCRWLCFGIMLLPFFHATGQGKKLSEFPRKGSYQYYTKLSFEDNSFLLEEAFNQPMGVIQHISNFTIDNLHGGNFTYSFTQEIPLTDRKHQLSYTLSYNIVKAKQDETRSNGFGDVYVSYRPMLTGERDWAMIIPRFTIILPTGKAKDGQGNGGWGGQFNLAITKRLSNKIVTHYNAGLTYISKADKYQRNINGVDVLAFEKNISQQNVGASVIYYAKRKFNVFLEYVSNFESNISDEGQILHRHALTLNPGLRFCIDNGIMQIVPGISMPVNFENGIYDRTGIFFYLSFERDYLGFTKPKGR